MLHAARHRGGRREHQRVGRRAVVGRRLAAFGVGGVRPRKDRLVGGVGLVGVTVSMWVAPITIWATACSFEKFGV